MIVKHIAQSVDKVKAKVNQVFDAERLDALAREVGFIQRSTGKLEAGDFLALMTTELLEDAGVSLEGLCDILEQLNPAARMSPQGLSQRINSAPAVTFLKEVFQRALQENLEPVREQLDVALLAPFPRVFIEDTTQCDLHEKLAEHFKGAGGSASTSSLKIDLTYELKHHVLQAIDITEGKVPDQAHAQEMLEDLQAGDLMIRDLGYFTLESLRKIEEQQAFFLSRLLKKVDVYLSDHDALPMDVGEYLENQAPDQDVVDVDVYLGKAKLPCRLIAYRLPEQVVNQRRRKANEVARRKGRQLTQAYVKWLQFGFYITNVSRETWPAEVVGTLYRLRWQIELTFKSWKSLLPLHILKGSRPERIECLLYGRLTTITILNIIYAEASGYAEDRLQRELSAHKLITWLKRKGRLAKAIHLDRVDAVLLDLRREIKKLCKQKRKRKTTRQLLEAQVAYLESFSHKESLPLQKAA